MHVISVMGLSIDKYRTASEAAIDFGKFSVSEFNKFDFFSNILFYDFLKILIIVPNKKNLTSRIWISSWNKNSFVERNHVRCFDIRNENECVRQCSEFWYLIFPKHFLLSASIIHFLQMDRKKHIHSVCFVLSSALIIFSALELFVGGSHQNYVEERIRRERQKTPIYYLKSRYNQN